MEMRIKRAVTLPARACNDEALPRSKDSTFRKFCTNQEPGTFEQLAGATAPVNRAGGMR
jgi:hypothetical protein